METTSQYCTYMSYFYEYFCYIYSAICTAIPSFQKESNETAHNSFSDNNVTFHNTKNNLYWEPAVEDVFNYGQKLWELCCLRNVWMLLTYLSAVRYSYKFMIDKYKSSCARISTKKMAKNQLLEELQVIEMKIKESEAECSDKSAEVKVKTERFTRVRGRVRELLTTGGAHACLNCTAIWDDIAMSGGGDDINTMTEILRKLNYEQAILPEKQTTVNTRVQYSGSCTDDNHHSTSSQSSGDANTPQDSRDRLRLVKVTNVYNMGRRHKGRKLRSLLKKKTESITKLLEEWQTSLNSVIDKKLAECKLIPAPRNLDVITATAAYNLYPRANQSESEERNDEADLYYGQEWSDLPYQHMPYDMQDDSFGVSSEHKYETQRCECNNPLGSKLLFILPEETNSQIEISEIEDRMIGENL